MPAELATSLVVTDDDRLLQAEAVVRSYCGWHIAPVRTATLRVPWFDGTLTLPTLHLVSVASITDADDVVIDPTEYGFTEAGVLYREPVRDYAYRYALWGQPVTIEYTHGYADPPPDITGAVVALAKQAASVAPGLQAQSTGPFSETYLSGLDAYGSQRAILDRYRLPPRP